MENVILLSTYQGKTCAALMEGKRLAEVIAESSEADNIYVGRVENVLEGMQAAFVNIGLDKNAFLPASDMPDFASLRPGMEIPVQTVKVPGGTKGVRVSGNITLAGRMSVLMPFSNGACVSKRISDPEENSRLRKIAVKHCPDNMGLIVRTNAAGASAKALENDIASLTEKWNELKTRLAHAKAPRMVYSGNGVAERAVRDMMTAETDRIIVDDEALCAAVKDNLKALSPDSRVKVQMHESDIALFNLYSVPSQIQRALSRKVWLPSGGYLVIDYTEALTVVDVNTGKFTGDKNLNDTVLRINMEAAREIASQLRLRDVGGIVIIDFIDMESQEDKDMLLNELKTALSDDRTHSTVVDITPLGLVEMTRRRKRERLNDIFRLEEKE